MTAEDRDELRAICAARATAGDRTAWLTLDLLGELERKDDLIIKQGERMAIMSQLLSKRAEKS